MEELKHKIIKLGWNVYEAGNNTGWEISRFSPAGEDFNFIITHNNNAERAKKEIEEYARDFAEEEHAKMWINAENVGQPSIKELVQDAEDIHNMLLELANNL